MTNRLKTNPISMANGNLSKEEKAAQAVMLHRLIDEYVNLQRIKSAADRDKEIEYQLKALKLKLAGCGFAAEKLDIG